MQMRSDIEIERPAGEVFAVLADFSRNPEWQRGMRSATWTTEPPTRIGSRYDQRASFLGREVVTTFEVTAYEDGESVTIESVESSFPIRVTRQVAALGPARTRVVAEIAGEPGTFFRMFGPVLRRMAERSVRADYRRLKQLLEWE